MNDNVKHSVGLAACLGAALLLVSMSAQARGTLCLTFDDSHFDDWESVMPLFEKYGARATFFANGELTPHSVAGLRRLADAGHSIGLHGRLHVNAPAYIGEHGADGWLRDEVLPQIDICRCAGLPLRNFAYPYNAWTKETDAILQGLGFAHLRSGVDARPGDAHELRGAFPASETGRRFQMRALGLGKSYGRGAKELLALLPRVAQHDLVLSTFSHRICESAPDNGISPQTLEQILAGASALGIAIVGFDSLPVVKPMPKEKHVFSMSVKVTGLNGELATPEGRAKAVAWWKKYHITKLWLESCRHGDSVETARLAEIRDAFRAEGFNVCGMITPTCLSAPTPEQREEKFWITCWNAPGARARIRGECARAARLFDTVIIDDFLFVACDDTCALCRADKARRSIADWGEYRRALMYEVCERDILPAAKEANPKAHFIIKYPCWYRDIWNNGYGYAQRGYSPVRQADLFGECWVGTETRDANPEPLQACWIAAWMDFITGGRCGGGWYDPLNCSPEKFIEQARYTILGGMKESLVHCYDYLLAEDPGVMYESSARSHDCCRAFEREIDGLVALAERLRGAERGNFWMHPCGVSRHEFRKDGMAFTIYLNTRDVTVDVPEAGLTLAPHEMRECAAILLKGNVQATDTRESPKGTNQ